jgi:hypothetical protein
MQLKIETEDNMIIEWIPYGQFNDIKNIYKGNFATVNSAIWRDGPFDCSFKIRKQTRDPNKEVALKYINNSQNDDINKFLNEVCNLIVF